MKSREREKEEEEEEEGEEDSDLGGRVGESQHPDLGRDEGVEGREQEGSEGAADNAVLIPLKDLLDFPRVRALCSSVDDIRYTVQYFLLDFLVLKFV